MKTDQEKEDVTRFPIKKLRAEYLGYLVWHMNSVAASVHHTHASETLRYDRSDDPERWFMKDIMKRDVASKYILEKWKDWTLVYADGSERKMSTAFDVPFELAAFREKKK